MPARGNRCSHCNETGHNIRTCPYMTTEERTNYEEQRNLRNQRRQARTAARAVARQENVVRPRDPLPGLRNECVRIINNNSYAVCVFWRFSEHNVWKMFSTVISEYCSTSVHFSNQHTIRVVPTDEIQSNEPTNVESMYVVGEINGKEFFETSSIIENEELEEGWEYVYTCPTKVYSPSKDPLTMWKHATLKSIFLLNELIRLGAKKNDTYGVILDMVQDIQLPEYSEIDKENAGIPSSFTNIT